GNLVLKKWDRKVEQWIARLSTLANAMPELELPVFSDEDKQAVIEQICLGALSYKQIKDREVWPELHAFLAPHQRPMLDQLVPDRLQLPNGKRARIRFEIGAKPILSARLQHLYDIDKTPSLADGRIPLRIEILAPNQRPVQLTEDLPGFWANSYEHVKKDLKGRYPKHEWR
ncbi:MAG: ATP-dependent helicase C-terminal domain-containing protein, partial [Verrucomicrobiota bacterium]